MRRRPKIYKFRDDREAAEFWATHDSTPYQRELREVAVKSSPELRRRIAVRAETKKPVTLRLEASQIPAAPRGGGNSLPRASPLASWGHAQVWRESPRPSRPVSTTTYMLQSNELGAEV